MNSGLFKNVILPTQRSTLNIERGDLWLKLTYSQPNIHNLLRAHQTHEKFIQQLKVCLHL